MKNSLLLCIIFQGILTFGFAQEKDVVLTKKEESAVRVLKATLFLGNKTAPSFFDHQEFKFHRDLDGSLEMTPKINLGQADPMVGDWHTKYRIDTSSNSSGLIELYDECERVAFIRIDQWKDHKAIRTSSHLGDGTLLYDAKDRIIGLDQGLSYNSRRDGKIYRKTMIHIGYDTKDRMNLLEEELFFYQKSSSSKNLKEDYTFKRWVSQLNYTRDKVTVQISNFREDEKEIFKAKQTLYEYTTSGYTSTVDKVVLIHKRNGEQRQRSYSEIKVYDTKYRLIQQKDGGPSYTKTFTYAYDEQGNTTEKNYAYKTNSNLSEEIVTQVFDARNLPIQSKKVLKTDGTVRETQETAYTYFPKVDGEEITKCVHKSEAIITFYNVEGNPFKQSNGSKFRTKKEGVWGSWEFYTY